jgi:hypothetical protein
VQVGQKQAVAAKKRLVVTVCVWAAYGECHAATAMVINCQVSHTASARSGHMFVLEARPRLDTVRRLTRMNLN